MAPTQTAAQEIKRLRDIITRAHSTLPTAGEWHDCIVAIKAARAILEEVNDAPAIGE